MKKGLAVLLLLMFSSQAVAASNDTLDRLTDVVFRLALKVKKLEERVETLEKELARRNLSRRPPSSTSLPNREKLSVPVQREIPRQKKVVSRSFRDKKRRESFVVATFTRPNPAGICRFIESLRRRGFSPRMALTPKKRYVVVVIKGSVREAKSISRDAYRAKFYNWENLFEPASCEDIYLFLKKRENENGKV